VDISRRHFLQAAGAVTLGFGGLHTLFRQTASASPDSSVIAEGYGPLQADPAGILELPEGFTYRIVSRVGDRMDDGFVVPGAPDGMAAFPGPDGTTVVVRNHELKPDSDEGPFGDKHALLDRIDQTKVYDYGFGRRPNLGGTTTFVYDTRTGALKGQRLSLAGTERNCAGGPTPWNTWITCEETMQRAGGDYERDHGYNFEVPADYAAGLADPTPIKDMGRFNHEAIAVDPESGIIYQTEDRGDGLLYRFLPNEPGNLAAGGRLQMLCVRGKPSFDTRNWKETTVRPGDRLDVAWLDCDGIDAPEDDLRLRGFDRGAARFARGEGMWYGEGAVFFACTNGGKAEKGQIWRYVPSAREGQPGELSEPGRLELFVEPNDGGLIDNADNLTVAPWGDLIVCEDGSGEQFLVGVTPEGRIYKFARNVVSDSEMAGATFSPDGSTLFFNIQHNGLTLAVTGPWQQRLA
jgi:hypothetical protein